MKRLLLFIFLFISCISYSQSYYSILGSGVPPTPTPNYAHWSGYYRSNNCYPSGSDSLTVGNVGGGSAGVCAATVGVDTGKCYFEITMVLPGNLNTNMFGFGDAQSHALTSSGIDFTKHIAYRSNTWCYSHRYTGAAQTTVGSGACGPVNTAGLVFGFAFDGDANTLSIYRANVLVVTISGIPSGTWYPYGVAKTTACEVTANFGQYPFTYTPPAGYKHGWYN